MYVGVDTCPSLLLVFPLIQFIFGMYRGQNPRKPSIHAGSHHTHLLSTSA